MHCSLMTIVVLSVSLYGKHNAVEICRLLDTASGFVSLVWCHDTWSIHLMMSQSHFLGHRFNRCDKLYYFAGWSCCGGL